MRLADIIAMDTTGADAGHSMPQAYCQITGFFSTYVSCVASHTIMAISWERFLLICYPFKSRQILTVSYTKHLLFAIWSLAFLVVLPLPLLFTYVAQVQLENSFVSFCLIDVFHTSEHNGDIYFLFLFLIYFAVPALLTAVAYGFVFKALNRQASCMTQRDEQTLKVMQSRKDVAKLMVFLAVLFTALHGPFFFLFLLISFGLKTPSNPIFTLLIIEFLPLLNGALDPIVYSSKSRSLFRKHMVSFLHKQYSVIDHNSIDDKRKSLTASLISKLSQAGRKGSNYSKRESTPSDGNTSRDIKADLPSSGISGTYSTRRSIDSSRSVSTIAKPEGSISRSTSKSPSRSSSANKSEDLCQRSTLDNADPLQRTGLKTRSIDRSNKGHLYDNVESSHKQNGRGTPCHVYRTSRRGSQSVERDLQKSVESAV